MDFLDSALEKNLHFGGTALRFQQVDDVLRGTVAEELSEGFLMVGNAMFFDERDEICGRVARQRGFCKVFVRGNKIFRLAKNVAAVAAAAAGVQDFLGDELGIVYDSE